MAGATLTALLELGLLAGCASIAPGPSPTPGMAPPSLPTAPSASALATAAPTSLGPVARGYALMADLPGEPGVVLLGGATRPGPSDLSDMWSFSPQSGWREITPAVLPELPGFAALTGSAFAFDTKTGLALFVDISGNPWTWDPREASWARSGSGGGPSALLGAAMSYDSQAKRMIVFGGLDLDTGREHAETWAYDLESHAWERRRPAEAPAARNFAAQAYDVANNRTVLFGGAPASGSFGDTWTYDYQRDSWTEMAPPTSPPARTYGWMAYDPTGERMLLVGGSADAETAAFGDVWAFDTVENAWRDVSPAGGPGPLAWHAMAFDSETSTVVTFGGGTSRTTYTAETWLLDLAADTWTAWR